MKEKAVKLVLRCPSSLPPVLPWGMNPRAKTNGREADPPRYPWSEYECFLMSGWRDIPN